MRKFFLLMGVLCMSVASAERKEAGVRSVAGLRANVSTIAWVLPHVFHLDDANTSTVIVNNDSSFQTIDLQIDFRPQSGEGVTSINAQAAPRATRIFAVSSQGGGFVGTAVVFCMGGPCQVQASWNFDFGGNDRFDVGVPGIFADPSASTWAGVTANSEGNFALAVFNNAFGPTECTVTHFNTFGDQVGTEMFMLASAAQRADFATVPDGFAGRSEVACDNNVWVTTVVQSDVNGFPTVGFPQKQVVLLP